MTTTTKMIKEILLKPNEAFRMIIDGRSNCGKTKLLILSLNEFLFNEKQNFYKIIICPTFPKNKTYQNEEFLFENNDILIC